MNKDTPIKAPQRQTLSQSRLADACKALGHPARIKIIQILLAEDQCVCGRIVEVIPLAQSTVSQHLKILKQAGLITGTINGPNTCYCVDKDYLNRIKEAMIRLLTPLATETTEYTA
jgi:DNA-binding transcriptional ArsR family regulator